MLPLVSIPAPEQMTLTHLNIPPATPEILRETFD
jgi:hypothetical protein